MQYEDKGFICVREIDNQNYVSVLPHRCIPYLKPCAHSKKKGCKVVQLNINNIEQTATAKIDDGGEGVAVAVNLGWINNYPLATGCCESGLLPPPIGPAEVNSFNLDGKNINIRIDEEGNVFLNENKIDENDPNVSIVKSINTKNKSE